MENAKLLHKCGLCQELFNEEEEYLCHLCSVTNTKPTEPEVTPSLDTQEPQNTEVTEGVVIPEVDPTPDQQVLS